MDYDARLTAATAALLGFSLAGAPLPKFPGTGRLAPETAKAMAEAALLAAHPVHAGRTDEQYAIEFGGYLATAATSYLAARNRLDLAIEANEMAYEDDESESEALDELEAARETVSEADDCLRNAIYQFTKRAERAGLGKAVAE
jgi:hypothetical protein